MKKAYFFYDYDLAPIFQAWISPLLLRIPLPESFRASVLCSNNTSLRSKFLSVSRGGVFSPPSTTEHPFCGKASCPPLCKGLGRDYVVVYPDNSTPERTSHIRNKQAIKLIRSQ